MSGVSRVCDRWRAEKSFLKKAYTHLTNAEMKVRRLHHSWICDQCGSTWKPTPNLPRDPHQEMREGKQA